MIINKKGGFTVGRFYKPGQEIKIKTVFLWNDLFYLAANLCGLAFLAWCLWPLF